MLWIYSIQLISYNNWKGRKIFLFGWYSYSIKFHFLKWLLTALLFVRTTKEFHPKTLYKWAIYRLGHFFSCQVLKFCIPFFRLLRPSLLMLCQQDMKVTKSYNFTSMSALPCGCPCKKPARTIEPKGNLDLCQETRFIHTIQETRVPSTCSLRCSRFVCVKQWF